LVPSRLVPGSFYALPQAPQQYKQLLMVAGADRYFQLARCFRDEDLRADRQPEFTQIDIEMSFVTPEDLYEVVDGMIVAIMEAAGLSPPALPLPRITYREAMDRYGTDKPDLRFGMGMEDLGDLLAGTGFNVFARVLEGGGVVKALNAKGLASAPIRVLDTWTDAARKAGLGGLAHIRIGQDGEWKSPIVKHLSEAEREGLRTRLNAEAGDLLLFGAGDREVVNVALGRLRLLAGDLAEAVPPGRYAYLWVTGFPLFERNQEGRLTPMHHPFTSPHPDDVALLDRQALRARAQAYDLVLNGVEIGGGSIRIHDTELQRKMFRLLQMPDEETQARFGHLLRALEYGAPPHGGIAFGFDRVAMLMAGEETIRDVIAFPKTQRAVDPMMDAPSPVDDQQLRELYLERSVPPVG
jgi:aspartyl-tRNA synthetase